MEKKDGSNMREGIATRVNLEESGATCDRIPKVSHSSLLVSPNAIINMPQELYNVDVAATFEVPLTIVSHVDDSIIVDACVAENLNVDESTMPSDPIANTVYGFFLGRKVAYPVVASYHPDENMLKEDVSTVPVWVKTPWCTCYGLQRGWCSSCKVFGHILDERPKNTCVGEKKTMKKPSQSFRGVPVGPKMDFKPQKEYRPVFKNSIACSSELQIGEGKLRLLDNDENRLVPTSIVKSDSEVKVVFDDIANLMISTSGKDGSDKGYGTNSLLEQWRDSYPDNDDYDPYDDDMYENHDLNNWVKHGLKRIMMNSKGFFFFKFDSRAGLKVVLEGGPWLVSKSPIILKKWLMDTRLLKEELTRILIWVKLHDVPIQVFEEDETNRVEYEWRPPRCDICKIFGHVHDHCTNKVVSPPIVITSNVVTPAVENTNVGFQTMSNREEERRLQAHQKKGATNVGNPSTSLSMLKTTDTSSKTDNIPSSNSYFVLNDEEEEEEEDVENVYDETANLFTKISRSSSFTADVEDCISLIATFIGKPVMLDSYISCMCNDSWGRSSFARCDICKIFGHVYDHCPNKVASPPIVTTSNFVTPTDEKTNDGFQTVSKKKKRKGKSKSTNDGQFISLSVKQNVRYEPNATTSAPKNRATSVGNPSTLSSMLKTYGTSSKKDNISTSNSYFVLNDEKEEE
nr:zinc knuckle CX2CX4HX4C [Tanacetum cinerariifolium]